MHDELKLEAIERVRIITRELEDMDPELLEVLRYSDPAIQLRAWLNSATPQPTRTLPPANTEADVERAFRAGHAAGFDCADNTSRAEVNHVEDAWDEYRAALSGGEEVRDPAYDYAVSLLRVLHGKHFPEQAGLKMLPDTLGVLTQIDNLTSALTKPPALPKEGDVDAAQDIEDTVHDCLITDLALSRAGVSTTAIRAAAKDIGAQFKGRFLSPLPVRSGEVDAAREALEPFARAAYGADSFPDATRLWDTQGCADRLTVAHLRAARAALATPQQVKEGDRHG